MLSGEWFERLDAASRNFSQALLDVVQRKSAELDGELNTLAGQGRRDIAWVRNRMLDDKVFLAEAVSRIDKLRAPPRRNGLGRL